MKAAFLHKFQLMYFLRNLLTYLHTHKRGDPKGTCQALRALGQVPKKDGEPGACCSRMPEQYNRYGPPTAPTQLTPQAPLAWVCVCGGGGSKLMTH